MGQQLGVKPGRPGSSWTQEGRGQASESQKGKQQGESHRVGQRAAPGQGTKREEKGRCGGRKKKFKFM